MALADLATAPIDGYRSVPVGGGTFPTYLLACEECWALVPYDPEAAWAHREAQHPSPTVAMRPATDV